MTRRSAKPLSGYSPFECIAKFIISFIIGICVDGAIIGSVLYGELDFLIEPSLLSIAFGILLLAIPVIWGVLGIFYFEQLTQIFNRNAYTKTRV